MKWLKRLLLIAGLILAGVIAFCLLGIYLYHGTPSWYRHRAAGSQQVRDAANSADQKLLDLFSWAASAHAQQLRRLRSIARPSDEPIGPKTVTFSEDELNSFLNSWQTPGKSDMQERISRYFTDGRVVFQPDAIILAGQSPVIDAVIGAEFDPSIDPQGNIRMPLASITAGRLPIPKAALGGQLDRLQYLLRQQLSAEQRNASIDPALAANGPALTASWLRLLLSALNETAADPYLIIPFDMTHLNRGLPVKLSAISVAEGQITLTMEPLAPDQRDALVKRLKEPPPQPGD